MAYNSPGEYIKSFPEDIQKILEKVRGSIKKVAPDAKEMMGYGVAAFELPSKKKVYYAAFEKPHRLLSKPRND